MAKLFIIVGPSAVGKNTVQDIVLAAKPDFVMPRGVWTRKYRPNEVPDSVRVSPEKFDDLRARGLLTGVADVHGNKYGTPKRHIRGPLAAGKNVLRILSVVGVQDAQKEFSSDEMVTIFLTAPREVLRERLEKRGDAAWDVERRMQTSEFELAHEYDFDYLVPATGTPDEVAAEVLRIIDLELDETPATVERTQGAIRPVIHVQFDPPATAGIPPMLYQVVELGGSPTVTATADDEPVPPPLKIVPDPSPELEFVPQCSQRRWENFDGLCRKRLMVTGREFLRAHYSGRLDHMWWGWLAPSRSLVEQCYLLMPHYRVERRLEAAA